MDYETAKAFSGMAGLLFFMIIFIGVVIWTFKPGSKNKMDEASKIPFKEDETNGNN